MIKNKKRFYFLAAHLFVFFVISSHIFAAEKTTIPVSIQGDFVVEPGKTEIVLAPGESVTKNITITSRLAKTTTFHISAEDIKGTDDASQAVVLLGDTVGPYSLKNFILPEIKEFTLKTGERISIPITVSIPKNAEPRGYYGALLIANEPEKITDTDAVEAQGKTKLVSRIGSLLLVRVKGQVNESGQLEDFKLQAPTHLVYQKFPKGFEVAFKNTGNVHLVPYGTITVKL